MIFECLLMSAIYSNITVIMLGVSVILYLYTGSDLAFYTRDVTYLIMLEDRYSYHTGL